MIQHASRLSLHATAARKRLILALLAGTAIIPLAPACAQISHSTIDEPTPLPPGAKANGIAAKPRRATAEDVLVTGVRRKARAGGLIKPENQAKTISTVSSEYISKQASVQNAYQYVALTPGVQVAQSDAYGLSEQGSINVRGLGQDEIGYVLEGMPLNDVGFYTAFPAQFIDSENIDEISLAQGSAELDSPVSSAAGGLMNISMLDPALNRGGSIDAAYGSYNMNREYVRFDTGFIGDTGVRAFISYSNLEANQWRGPGYDKRTHIDFKAVKEWGDGNRIAWVGTYHDGLTPNYPYTTLANFQQYGRYGANILSDTYYPGNTNYWKLWDGTWKLFYTSLPVILNLDNGWHFEATPYWLYNNGNTPFGTTLTTTGNYQGTAGPYTINIPFSQNGVGTVANNYNETQFRAGFTPKFTYEIGHQKIIFGYWIDYGDEVDNGSYSWVSNNGEVGDLWANNQNTLLKLPNGQILYSLHDHIQTETNMAYIADTLSLLDDKLIIEAGFKEAIVRRFGTNDLPGNQYRVTLNTAEPLPRFSVRYKIDSDNQVYFNATTNFRAPAEATILDTYYAGYESPPPNPHQQTEYSILEELGYRYNGPLVTATISLFNYNFTHRQVSTLVGGNFVTETFDTGGQTSRGIDLEAGMKPWHHFSPYISFEYLHATEDNDFAVPGTNGGTDYIPTAGKIAIRSPATTGAIGLNYDDGDLFSTLSVKYVGSQYTTFADDQKIPAYATADFTVGYRFPSFGLRGRPELRLNIINLTDNNYLAGVASPSSNANTIVAKYGTVVQGTQPMDIIGGGIEAVVTLRQTF